MDLIAIYALIFGFLIGSFLNVVILRLPLGKDIVFKPSSCPKCQTKITWWMNIPVIGFLILRGKCYYCHERISWRYPLIEIVTGATAYFLAPEYLTGESLLNFFFFFSIFCIFLCHFVIDLDHYLLLDSLNIILFLILGSYSLIYFSWGHLIGGFLVGFGMTFLITWLFYKYSGKVGLGGGDIKLFGILGLYLGPLGILSNIVYSCFLGILIFGFCVLLKRKSKDEPIPFGPAIIITAFVQIFFPHFFADINLYNN